MANGSTVRIGTSGWHYEHWKGTFYPEDIKNADMLAFYAERFKTVEINNSFYKLPETKTMQNWRDTVKKQFLFAVKASRYITHVKKLKDGGDTFPNLRERIDALESKLGPVLFQLPPGWSCNRDRLVDFCGSLPEGYRYAFEFRNRDWWNDDVLHILQDKGAAFCIYELNGTRSPFSVTGDFVYIRLHGPDAAYQGDYDDPTLSEWADRIAGWLKEGKDVYCYFDNDQAGYAARNAMRLKMMLSV